MPGVLHAPHAPACVLSHVLTLTRRRPCPRPPLGDGTEHAEVQRPSAWALAASRAGLAGRCTPPTDACGTPTRVSLQTATPPRSELCSEKASRTSLWPPGDCSRQGTWSQETGALLCEQPGPTPSSGSVFSVLGESGSLCAVNSIQTLVHLEKASGEPRGPHSPAVEGPRPLPQPPPSPQRGALPLHFRPFPLKEELPSYFSLVARFDFYF